MTKWLVNGLIPEGHVVLLLGQPHSGKSWFVEQLALCIQSGERFLGHEGFSVQKGSVIIIDEDTPTDTLEERLNRLAAGIGVDVSRTGLDWRSMQGFLLYDDKQIEALKTDISRKSRPLLLVIDSLSGVMGGWNQNTTSDALKAASRWNELKTTGATLLITHHMSLHRKGSYKDWDFTAAGMGNTQLVGKSDTAIGMWAIPPVKPTRFIVKAKPRRKMLKATEPFTVQLIEPDDESWVYLGLIEEIPSQPSEVARQIFPLFYRDRMENTTVQDVLQIVSKDYSEAAVREALHELIAEGALVRDKEKKGKSHRHRYSLNPEFENEFIYTTSYWDELRQ